MSKKLVTAYGEGIWEVDHQKFVDDNDLKFTGKLSDALAFYEAKYPDAIVMISTQPKDKSVGVGIGEWKNPIPKARKK